MSEPSTAATPEAASPGFLFRRMAVIGIGLIGSSLARACASRGLVETVVCGDHDPVHVQQALELEVASEATVDLAAAVRGADLVVLAVPIGACGAVAAVIAPHLAPGCIVTDVGSVKQAVVRDVAGLLPDGVHFVPGHPIAGTEHSGPAAGFAHLFEGRWCILTPLPGSHETAVAALKALWEGCGSMVACMTAQHHDRVLAITSHLPHLIAYTIVGTAVDLEDDVKSEVIKFSASGFRDFTRIAASDPTMWRDVFLNNREAVLEIIQRFTEDLTALQRAIRWGEGETLFKLFDRTRAIRRSIIEARQDR